jgi:hypothetical protein
MDPTWLMLSGLFSLIGFAVFTYGRRQRTATHTGIGIALMAYPSARPVGPKPEPIL